MGSLSNGDIFNDLHGPLARLSKSRQFLNYGASYTDKVTIAQQ